MSITRQQLLNMKADVDTAASQAAAANASLSALAAAARSDVERRLLRAQAGHQAHRFKVLNSRSVFLAAQAEVVFFGGMSSVTPITTSADLNPVVTLEPTPRGRLAQ